MAPTIQTGSVSADKQRPGRPQERRPDLLCRVKYCNTLPDIPFDPKFITYPFQSNRFVEYKPTSLERTYKHELLTEHDLGVVVDLINEDLYAIDQNALLDPADEKLLEEEVAQPKDSKRSRSHAHSVPWLRRTEYISNEFIHYASTSDKSETKVGYSVKKLFSESNLYMDRDSQIQAIEKTFSDAKLTIDKHYAKPNVVPLEILPIFPDFEMWKYPCAQVMFDSDPAPTGRPLPVQIEEMSQAMIRGVQDESGDQFVAYFLPTDETLLKRKRDVDAGMEYVDEEEYEYKMAREYNWNVKNKASKGYEETYFFVLRQKGCYYNELETRVRLSKRRAKAGTQPSNSKLVVRHRPLNEPEMKNQEYRLMQLEPPQEEEDEEDKQKKGEEEKEDEEEEEEEEEEKEKEGKGKKRRISTSEEEDDKEEEEPASRKKRKESSDDSDKENSQKRTKGSDSEDEDEEEETPQPAQKPSHSDSDNSDKSDDETSDKEKDNAKKSDSEDESDEEEKKSDKASRSPSEASSKSSASEAESDEEEGKKEERKEEESGKSSAESSSEESDSDSEEEAKPTKKQTKDEAEIFGSDSDSD